MLIASSSPGAAQGTASSFAPSPAAPGVAHVPSTCRVAASVAGGVVGALVGGTAGALIERAFYPESDEAGLTGLSVGIIAGAGLGIHFGPRVCGVDAAEFRRHLREEVSAPPHDALPRALPTRRHPVEPRR